MKVAMLFSLTALAIPCIQADERTDGMRFMPNVSSQFKSLTQVADALGFHIGDTPNPSDCRHYQGLVRVDGEDGTPFFLVSRSGSTPELTVISGLNELLCDDSPSETRNGHLVIFRAGSRDKNGERMRSNRLKKDKSVGSTQPPSNDIATTYYTVVGGDPTDPDQAKRPGLVFEDGPQGQQLPRVYQHPGGMQAVGNILAIAADGPRGIDPLCSNDQIGDPLFTMLQLKLQSMPNYCSFDIADYPSIVIFLDVSDPENPVFKSRFIPTDEYGIALENADGLGLTPLVGDRYLMVVTGGFEGDLYHYYRSTSGDLASADLYWEYVGNTAGPSPGDNINQSLNFLREGDINGPLFLAAARGHIVVDIIVDKLYEGEDRIALYQIECDTAYCEPDEQITLTDEVTSQKLFPFPSVGGGEIANLAAASGFYVSPTGELLFYAFKHDNDGIHGIAQAGEWRHKDVLRFDNPMMLPGLTLNGPFEVDEGGIVNLSGTATPPTTKAWIQPISTIGFYPVVDFEDYLLDDFDNFSKFSYFALSNFLGLSGNAHQWNWYAPVGCSIEAMDDQGDLLRTLTGTGFVESDNDLSLVLNDFETENIDLKVNGIRFNDNCNQYYTTPVALQWDLDMNGDYETMGSSVVFNASTIDGPSTITVPVQAMHPSGGRVKQATEIVSIRNVSPQIDQFRLIDGLGKVINLEVPFVLTGQPVIASAVFSDPGELDHQIATLDWGDGLVEPQSTFTTYSDAFGGNQGAASHTHHYASSGLYSIVLSVLDDDGGVDDDIAMVTVQTPQEAVASIIDLLDNIIASTASDEIRGNLEQALKALTGSVLGKSSNGALNMISTGQDNAAIAFLHQAIKWLKRTQMDFDDIVILISILEQVIIALEAE